MPALARILTRTVVDAKGCEVSLVWKARRATDVDTWRWELRRMLDSQFCTARNLKYCDKIKRLLPDWVDLWEAVGVLTASSYKPSRRTVLGHDFNPNDYDDEYSVNTACMALE